MIGHPLTPEQQKIYDNALVFMKTVVIPEIVKTMWERQLAASKSREQFIRT